MTTTAIPRAVGGVEVDAFDSDPGPGDDPQPRSPVEERGIDVASARAIAPCACAQVGLGGFGDETAPPVEHLGDQRGVDDPETDHQRQAQTCDRDRRVAERDAGDLGTGCH